MTKEEILIEKGLLTEYGTLFRPIGEAMDEYAKQEAIEFAMWVHFNWQHLGDKFFLQRDGLSLDTIEEIEKTAITREEMYNLYQQSKK